MAKQVPGPNDQFFAPGGSVPTTDRPGGGIIPGASAFSGIGGAQLGGPTTTDYPTVSFSGFGTPEWGSDLFYDPSAGFLESLGQPQPTTQTASKGGGGSGGSGSDPYTNPPDSGELGGSGNPAQVQTQSGGGQQVQLNLSPQTAKDFGSYITAPITAAEKAVAGYLEAAGNWFVRGFLIVVGLVIVFVALWKATDTAAA